jgi:hypothetical protein
MRLPAAFFRATFFLGCLAVLYQEQALTSNDPKVAKPVPDYAVKLYDAKPDDKLQGDDLKTLLTSIPCTAVPFSVLPDPGKVQPDDGKTVFVINLVRWTVQDGSYSLDKSYRFPSEWYVYQRRVASGSCTFEQTGFKAHGEPLIYAKKRAWFLGINHFSSPVDPRNLTINYKIAVTPGIPENIQNLGSLISALLGAAAPALVAPLRAAEPVSPDTLVTIARIDGVKPLPFLINFAYAFAVTPPGGLPVGRVGIPYSASVAANGGNGSYSYIVSSGSLPPGLGLDPASGTIAGIPTAGGKSIFTIQVADNSTPPASGAFPAEIAISNSSAIAVPPPAAPVALTPGYVGTPYFDGFYGAGGTAPFSFAVAAGTNLPAGLYLNPNGLISGVPTVAAGPTNLSIVMSDSAKPPVASAFTAQVTIGPPKTSLSIPVTPGVKPTGALPILTNGNWFATTIQALGGTPPTTITINTLPAGLAFNTSTGVLSGVPNQSGKFPLTVHIEDSSAPKNTRDVELGLVVAEPLLTLTLGSTQATNGGQQGGNQQKGGQGGQQNQQGNKSQNNGNGNGNGNGNSNSTQQSGPTVPTVDCTAVNQNTPCSFSHSLQSDDKELIDFSIGVSIPGVRETIYSSPTASSVKRHTDLYGIVDIYPLFYWKNKETAIPHLSVGMPLTSQPFYRPYFGLSENLTTWSGFERLFPLRLKLFAGVVLMKQQTAVAGVGSAGSPMLKSERVTKAIAGIEIPIGPMVSKITGGKSQTSSKGQGQSGGSK